MGQYYRVLNVDKREMLVPWSFGNGAKLMEWSYNRNDMVLAMMNLIATTWKGDRVFVVGDYAEDDDKNEPCYEAVKNLIDELGIRDKMEDGYPVSIYRYASENFKEISGEVDTEDNGFRYIYNHKLKEVIDLNKCPVEWEWWDKENKKAGYTTVAPLSLLLAMGNDRGGGDFHSGHNGYEYVGSWCDSSQYIEVTTEPIDGLDYEEFAPDFTENNPLIPYTDAVELVKKQEEEHKGR